MTDSAYWTIQQFSDYEQGQEGGEMSMQLVCKNVPTGTKVGFVSSTPGPSPILHLPETEIPSENYIIGMDTKIPDNWSASILYYATTPSGEWPANAEMSLRATYVVSSVK